MILAVDAGNSRVKWGVFDDHGLLIAQGAVDHQALGTLPELWREYADCRRAVVANVAGEAVAARLNLAFAALNLPVLWTQPQATACGVKNGYQQPEQLGADRWAALIAAWNTYHQPCVVANAGTGLTVDALSGDGEFLGGLILPGMGLMRSSLATGTAAVAVTSGLWRDFPNMTADAVHTGILSAMTGAVRHMLGVLELREGRAPHCVLSGGDAEALAAALPTPTLIAPHLVLQGLFLLEKTSV